MIDVDFVHLRNAFNRRAGRTLFGYGEGQGEEAVRKALSQLMICPVLHLPDVSKAADGPAHFYCGGPNMGMNSLQQVSLEIREQFKAGEHVVFGAHVDENMGDHVQIIVLGADLEAGLSADVAPVAEQVMQASPKAKAMPTNPNSRPKRKPMPKWMPKWQNRPSLHHERGKYFRGSEHVPFMWKRATSGVFLTIWRTRIYMKAKTLMFPSYLRRGVKIAVPTATLRILNLWEMIETFFPKL